MIGNLCFFTLILQHCFVIHDAVSTLTAAPEIVASEEDLIVTGYANFRGSTAMRIILEEVTWYEARGICEEAGYGRLDDATHYHMRTSMAFAALKEAGINANLSLWTSYFRQDVTSNDWFSVSVEDQCDPKTLTIDSNDDENQCVANRYPDVVRDPLLEVRNCSDKLSFVCVDWLENGTNFTRYTGYDFSIDPADSTVVTEFQDLKSCVDDGFAAGLIVGFSYNFTSNECRLVKADFGFQLLQYGIEYFGEDVSHFTKTGTEVTIVEQTAYADEIIVAQTFSCPVGQGTTPPTSETQSIVGTSTPTLPLTSEITPTNLETSTSVFVATTEHDSQSTEEVTEESPEINDTLILTVTSTIGVTSTITSYVTSTILATQTVTASATSQTMITIGTTSLASSTNTALTTTSNGPTTASTHRSSSHTTTTSTPTSTSTPSTSGRGSTLSTTLTGSSIGSTSPSVSTPPTITTTANNSICFCNLSSCHESSTLNETEIEELVEIIVKNLTVERKETYKFKSTLVSAEDSRVSARAMGFVAAIVMCFVFGPIFISDIVQIARRR